MSARGRPPSGLIEILRLFTVIFFAGLGYETSRFFSDRGHANVLGPFNGLAVAIIVGSGIGFVVGGILGRTVAATADRCRPPDPRDQLVGDRIHRVHREQRRLHRPRRRVRRGRGVVRAPRDEPGPAPDAHPLNRIGSPATSLRQTGRAHETQAGRIADLGPEPSAVLDHPSPERHLADHPARQ